MKRCKNQEEEETITMDIVRQNLSNPPHRNDYIFRDGIRYVKPYHFEFISYAKKRWEGKTIIDLFTDDFKGQPRDYYVSAVKGGRIRVDGKIVPISYVVRPSQKISHFLHRHEPPVMARDVKVLHIDPEVVTVFKPASVPVHSCGPYHKNTIIGILQAEHDLAPLFPIHRLDRLVSGLLILARSASKAESFRQQIVSREIKKQYIARVTGVFPDYEQVANVNINHSVQELKCTVEEENSSKGKSACTKFTRISTNGTQSIVLCEPITGRTHQIRVHLQFLGYPIANDMLYPLECVGQRSVQRSTVDRSADEPVEDFSIDPLCTNCPNWAPKGYDGDEEGLWLHCIRYSAPDWTYECPYPDWASLT